jgi:hypothetical protein
MRASKCRSWFAAGAVFAAFPMVGQKMSNLGRFVKEKFHGMGFFAKPLTPRFLGLEIRLS